MFRQSGIVVFETYLFETFGQIHGVFAVFLHTDVEGVEVLVDGGAAHRIQNGAQEHAGTVVHIDEAVDVFCTAADSAGHAVVGAVDVFGHRVDGHVGAKFAGAENHGGEGVVNNQFGTGGMGHFAQFGHIGDAEQGVVHGLGVDNLGVGVLGQSFAHCIEVLHVDESGLHVEFLEVVGQEGEGAAIGGHGAYDVVAGFHFVNQGAGDGCQARTCNPSGFGAFHCCQRLAEGEVGGVPVAAVEEEALGFAVECLGHEVCLGKGECGAVADSGVNTTVGVAAVKTLDSGCGIEMFHNVCNFILLIFLCLLLSFVLMVLFV